MPISDNWFKIKENPDINLKLRNLIENEFKESCLQFSKKMDVSKSTISKALHNKPIEIATKIKIARFFGKDTIEIF